MTSPGSRLLLSLRVTEARHESENIRSLVLRRSSGEPLPSWQPGAHIDVVLPDGTTRQYSLCGDPQDQSSYRIAVLREPDGRGGSLWVHDQLAVGEVIQVRSPLNHFALEDAAGYTFLAGGIGITPILSMVKHIQTNRSAAWRLIYAGRSQAAMAFLSELECLGERVRVFTSGETGRPDVRTLLDELPPEHLLYVCGPAGLIHAVQQAAEATQTIESVRYELFTAPLVDDDDASLGPPFEVELRRSGETIKVPPTSTILREVRAAGVHVLSDCQDGICGSCETAVIAGDVEHRDHVLTLEEQRANDVMMICVSRCRGGRLVLDL